MGGEPSSGLFPARNVSIPIGWEGSPNPGLQGSQIGEKKVGGVLLKPGGAQDEIVYL